MCGNSAYDWNIRLTGRRCGGLASRSSPSSVTVPSSGDSKPARMRSSVVLPQPLGPSSAKNSPCRISRETSDERRDVAEPAADTCDLQH